MQKNQKVGFDFDSFEDKCLVPNCFDKVAWQIGKTYKIRVGYVYNPSNFWIIRHEEELNLFHKYITYYYSTKGDDYLLPEKDIKRDSYCAVYIDDCYYRAVIVDIPKFLCEEPQVVIFSIDFGFTTVVSCENLCYLSEKLRSVPRFAIRARLAGIEPDNSDSWSNKAAERFSQLIIGKILLAVLENKDTLLQVLYIKLGEVTTTNEIIYIDQILFEEKLAVASKMRRLKSKETKDRIVPKVKYPFLFPSHNAIETSLMPSSNYVSELLKSSPLACSLLFKLLYHKKIFTVQNSILTDL
ncbi:unnamed protein product [Phyllotreta striolata]|uniref:Tudor domain-containing protein n=1 Tax=Phyllotreta striolata TaxID=444603 RepID=A0A9N9TVC9_PHYSR|nr:unnamed protein product [Phyllotreta striolata]